ncbi:MAG: NAD-dependent epimerase/dehydratase family protein [Desulfuromonadaceae bacterium]|nr:NAD-dependent epimerase/dehydratase family protein [Desulfuromonadaceae bacterium]MDD2855764.1 NAD-dependent epimerase/dehydratase family protein [Desulfuromonadaceae bacterium]
MNIFVAGGTGFVGEHLIRQLKFDGHKPKLLVHHRSTTFKDVDQMSCDISDIERLSQGMAECDAVINLIGIIREFPSRGVTFEKLHTAATAALLEAAAKSGVRRYLQMSALGSRADAVSGYHKSKWQAEELVRSSALYWTVFRPSLIFGPRDAFINMLADQLRLAPVMPVIGSGSYRLQPVHADDVARCFSLALDMPETFGKSYEICGRDRISYEALIDMISESMGRSVPFKPHLPLGLMKLIIPVMQKFSQFPITMDQLQMLLEENIGGTEWQEVFGFQARALREGIREYLSV